MNALAKSEHSTAVEATDLSPMQASINSVEFNLDSLEGALNNLVDKLTPVLTPDHEPRPITGSKDETSIMPRAPMVAALDNHNVRMAALQQRIVFLTNRLTV